MAVICRIILCSFLTCFVQFIAFRVSSGPHSSGFIIVQGVSVALSLVLLFFIWKEFVKMSAYLVRARMAQRPDRFNPGRGLRIPQPGSLRRTAPAGAHGLARLKTAREIRAVLILFRQFNLPIRTAPSAGS